MAVVLGTNAGFVENAPGNDPGGIGTIIDNYGLGVRDTSPVGTNKITEIGWWCDNATQESNFEVGLYSHDAGDNDPDARLFVDAVNAKGTGNGWKTVTVDWSISASTIYWIAAQLDNTGTETRIDRTTNAGGSFSSYTPATSLPNPWFPSSSEIGWVGAIYAKWEVDIGGGGIMVPHFYRRLLTGNS